MVKRRPDESDASYISRLEASNAALRSQGDWAKRTSRAVTWLACDASLAFQAMAEKAGVRAHPSVTQAVEAFSTIAHPQWADDAATVAFPVNWDLEPVKGWSGDADMELNAGVAAALDYLRARLFARGVGQEERASINAIMESLERPIAGIVDQVIPGRGPRAAVAIPDDATRDDLANVINDLTWRALDLAQDLAAANEMLRRDLRAGAYRAVCRDLYALSSLCVPVRNERFDVKVIGGEAPF